MPADLPVLEEAQTLSVEDPHLFEVGTHCGVGILGRPINGHFWITDESGGASDWIPEPWAATLGRGDELLVVVVELSSTPGVLTVTLADRSVTYRPVTDDDERYLCA